MCFTKTCWDFFPGDPKCFQDLSDRVLLHILAVINVVLVFQPGVEAQVGEKPTKHCLKCSSQPQFLHLLLTETCAATWPVFRSLVPVLLRRKQLVHIL